VNKFETISVLDTKYAYALGCIRAREIRLLSKKRFEELISSKDVEELIAALHDTDYGQYLHSINPYRYEEGLERARIELFNEMEKLTDDPEIMKVLRARFDFHNITVLLKGKIAEEDYTSKCSPLGYQSVDELVGIFKEERYEDLPFYLHKAVREGVEAYFTHNHNPQILNFSIDSIMAETLTSYSENDFLTNYYKIWIDITNLKTILRLFFLERYKELANIALLPGGFILREEILLANFDRIQVLDDFYKRTVYYPLLEWKDSFSDLERAAEVLLISFLKSVSFESIGVEPIISYLFIRENEIRNLRLIFIGKINAVKDEVIKERLIV